MMATTVLAKAGRKLGGHWDFDAEFHKFRVFMKVSSSLALHTE